jgi:WD40 repeat protein
MRRWLLFVLISVSSITLYSAQAQEDIPFNCPFARGVFYQQTLVPRYEAHNGRVVLVDWLTGAEERTLATGITAPQVEIGKWSPECQYLSVDFATVDEQGVTWWDTVVYDVVNGGEVMLLEDARLIPYPITWDTNSTLLLVETRFGAYLRWLDGAEVWLTSDGDYNAQSFAPGTLVWDYANGQLRGQLTLGSATTAQRATAVYSLSTGELISLTDANGLPVNLANLGRFADAESLDGERYPCREWRRNDLRILYDAPSQSIVAMDFGTREVIRVIEANVSLSRFESRAWLQDCKYLTYLADSTLVIFDAERGERALEIVVTRRPHYEFDPTENYILLTNQFGVFLYHIPTAAEFRLMPHTSFAAWGSGIRWGYVYAEWDMGKQQVRLVNDGSWFFSRSPEGRIETRVFDLNTGALVEVLDRDGQPFPSSDTEMRVIQQDAPYGCGFSVQYQPYNQQIILRSSNRDVVITTLEEGTLFDSFAYLGRSPECRYMAAHVREGGSADEQLVIWDLTTKTRMATFSGISLDNSDISWSPYGGYAVVHTLGGAYLWHIANDNKVQLTQTGIQGTATLWSPQFGDYDLSVISLGSLHWDMGRGQVLGVPTDDPTRVIAYALADGRPVAEYGVDRRASAVSYILMDSSRMVVFGARNERESMVDPYPIAIWDRSTGMSLQLASPAPTRGIAPTDYNRPEPIFSPDGRYIMFDSMNFVYIWDTANLAGESPYAPTYVHAIEGGTLLSIGGDRFAIERDTTTREDFSRGMTEFTTYIYGITDGALIEEIPQREAYDYWVYSDRPR